MWHNSRAQALQRVLSASGGGCARSWTKVPGALHTQDIWLSMIQRMHKQLTDKMLACVQMASGTPPLAELHPMRALFLIPKNAAPQLQGPYSPALREFVGRCLHKVRAGPPVVCLL